MCLTDAHSDSSQKLQAAREELLRLAARIADLARQLPGPETTMGQTHAAAASADAPEVAMICDEVAELLREEQTLQHPHPHSATPPIETIDIQQVERMRCGRIFEGYLACVDVLTPREWQAVWLCYREGLSELEAGQKLGTERSTISSQISTANAKKEKREKELREEKLRLTLEILRRSS